MIDVQRRMRGVFRRRVLSQMRGTSLLVVNLLYGSGMRLLEALELRVKDIDFDRGEIFRPRRTAYTRKGAQRNPRKPRAEDDLNSAHSDFRGIRISERVTVMPTLPRWMPRCRMSPRTSYDNAIDRRV